MEGADDESTELWRHPKKDVFQEHRSFEPATKCQLMSTLFTIITNIIVLILKAFYSTYFEDVYCAKMLPLFPRQWPKPSNDIPF